jgi:hypothetical protein
MKFNNENVNYYVPNWLPKNVPLIFVMLFLIELLPAKLIKNLFDNRWCLIKFVD